MAITVEEMYFGAGTVTVGGVDAGATMEGSKLIVEIEAYTPEFQNAKGPVKATDIIRKVLPKLDLVVNQLSALRMAWAFPGSTSTSSPGVGGPVVGGGGDTNLAAASIVGATNFKVDGVTSFTAGDFVFIGPPTGRTELNSEIARIDVVGTGGGGGTGIDVRFNSLPGSGALLAHPDTDDFEEINGTTLAADAAKGATNIKVTAVTNFAQNDYIRIGDPAVYEIRRITAVGTQGEGGTGITIDAPLLNDHDAGDWIVEVTGTGKTTITWTPGRVPSGDYRDVILTAPGLDGREYIVTLSDAISLENQELEFKDDAMTGLHLILEGRYDPATPTVVPFSVELA